MPRRCIGSRVSRNVALGALAAALLAAGPAVAVVFDSGTVVDVTADLGGAATGVHDGPGGRPDPTVVNVFAGGRLSTVTVDGGSSVNLLGGVIDGSLLSLREDSRAFLGAGLVQGGVRVVAGAELTLACATLDHFVEVGTTSVAGGTVRVLGGSVDGDGLRSLRVLGPSGHATLLSGVLNERVEAYGRFEMHGGSLSAQNQLYALDASFGTSLITGGSVQGRLFVGSHGTLRIVGRSFNRPFGPVAHTSGQLVGVLADGTPIDALFLRANNPIGQIFLESGSSEPVNVGFLPCTGTGGALSYAALGDSYSSGEGGPPFFAGTDTPLNECHRSPLSYALGLRIPGTTVPLGLRPDVDFDFLACSGAVARNVAAAGVGQYGEPQQMAPQNRIDTTRDLVTISIGGNDAGFAPLLKFCLLFSSCNSIQPFAPHSDFELGDLFPVYMQIVKRRVIDLLEDLRAATPNAPTLVVGYPILLGGQVCPAVQPLPFLPDVEISADEQAWMRDSNRLVNTAIEDAAREAGVHFVPLEEHFETHEVCGSADDWIRGVVLSWPVLSFHPNERGWAESTRAVNAYLESKHRGWPYGYFPSGLPRNPDPAVLPPLVPGPLPTFGDLDVELAGACPGEADVVAPGAPVQLSASGFAANETVQLRLEAPLMSFSLGSAAADAAGELVLTITMPTTLQPGLPALIAALGAGPTGLGHLAVELVRVEPALTTDADADSIPDACDNCPSAANLDQSDFDTDGSGDVCDLCPEDSGDDLDEDGLCGGAGADLCPLDPLDDEDGDGWCALDDNCPAHFNPSQADLDGDGQGDRCDPEVCGDGVQTGVEVCDDGNTAAGDGCDTTCAHEPGFESACANGIDDDGDGALDGADSGCSDTGDASERNPLRLCDDGIDNDGDFRSDFDPRTRNDTLFAAGAGDPACASSRTSTESPVCDDGVDNDHDTLVDWDGGGLAAPDPICTVPWGAREAPVPSSGCGIGAELLVLLAGLRLLRRALVRFAAAP